MQREMSAGLIPEEAARSHRYHAVECNNAAWTLADSLGRTRLESEEMLNAAHDRAIFFSTFDLIPGPGQSA